VRSIEQMVSAFKRKKAERRPRKQTQPPAEDPLQS
jgi:hypothetical protein